MVCTCQDRQTVNARLSLRDFMRVTHKVFGAGVSVSSYKQSIFSGKSFLYIPIKRANGDATSL